MRPAGLKNLSSFLLFLLLTLTVILFDSWNFFQPLKTTSEEWLTPLKSKVYLLRREKTVLTEDEKIKADRERKIADLENQMAVLKTENASMRRLLGAPVSETWRFLPAKVIGSTSLENLQIDRGRADGVKEGMVVIEENVFIGRVVKVGVNSATVFLPTSEGSKILAASRSEDGQTTKTKGLLIGQGNRMNFERVLLKEEMATGDLLTTLGDEILPPNLLLGKIGKVSKKEGDIYQRAEVQPLVDYEQLENVFVITNLN